MLLYMFRGRTMHSKGLLYDIFKLYVVVLICEYYLVPEDLIRRNFCVSFDMLPAICVNLSCVTLIQLI